MQTRLGHFVLTLDPEAGGKVARLEHARLGRSLLQEAVVGGELVLEDGAVFSASGWVEAFPTLQAYGEIPRLGWAWRTPAECRVEGGRVRTEWDLPGWGLEREISVEGETLVARYVIENRQAQAARGLWAGHALYPAEGLVRAELPAGEVVLGPGCDRADLVARLTSSPEGWGIEEMSDLRKSWKFFLPAAGEVVLHYRDARLVLATDAPWWGVWLNRGALGVRCLGIEPTNAATDDVGEVGAVEVGGRREWWWSLGVEAGVEACRACE